MSETPKTALPSGWMMERREVVYVNAAKPTVRAPLAVPRTNRPEVERPSAVLAIARTPTRFQSAEAALSDALQGLIRTAPGFTSAERREVGLPDGSRGYLLAARLEPAPGQSAHQLHLVRLDGAELVHGTVTVEAHQQC